MKAFWMNPDYTIYVADSADQAKALYEAATGEVLDDAYPIEVSAAELQQQRIKYDEYQNPTKEITSISDYLNKATDPGFLCDGNFL